MVENQEGATNVAKSPKERKKAGVPWTPEEHKRFLLGLSALGKGDWRGISRHYVQTRTPTQVASHAQKYFIRQTSTGNKRKRRTSLFDTTLDSVCVQNAAGDHRQQHQHNANNGSHSGSLATERDDAQQPSVSPNSVSAQDHQQTGSLPLGIVPVGILAGDHHQHDHDQGGQQLHGGVPGMMAQQIAGMGALAGAMAGGAGLFVPPGFGMFPALDPGTVMMLMSSMMGQHHPQRMSPQIVSGAVPPQIFRPLAVRYTSTEVQKFKSAHGNEAANGNGAANGASGANTEANGADKQATKGKVAIAPKPKDPASQSLSNGNSSSSQTTLEVVAT